MTFSAAEIEFLVENKAPYGPFRWLCSANAKPTIKDLQERGLMMPAYGEFGPMVDKGETVNVLGKTLPIVTMISLYTLTRYGRAQLKHDVREKLSQPR